MKKGIEHELLIWKILNEIRESSRFKNSKQFIPVSYTHLDVYKRQAYTDF